MCSITLDVARARLQLTNLLQQFTPPQKLKRMGY
jgi:hypothetical protein